MYRLVTFFSILSIVLLPKFSLSTIVTSNGTGGGDWDTPGTWIPAGVPGCVDTISILAGDIVDISSHQDYEACPPMIMLIYGTLNFPDNGPKLRLPCGSSVVGFAGGSITAPGDDNSNKIFICGDVVWESKDPDSFGPFLFGSPPLPVTLMNFEAKIDNTSIELIWRTSVELNNDFFTLERSENGTSFEELGIVSGNGNSTIIREYSYFDDAPIFGTSYYRLKQTDYNGEFEYVKLIAVNYSQNEDGICTLKVYPNPCVGACTINLEDCPLSDNDVNVELYDAFGKKIENRISPKSITKDISFHLNTSNNLAPGVYIVKSSAQGKDETSKVIVK